MISYLCPNTVYILSEENEDNTKDNIETMGIKLSQEVKNFIANYTDGKELKISFIGHSLGGLIV